MSDFGPGSDEGRPASRLTTSLVCCPFWGREFEVSPAVLVPRPETELVVQVALELPLSADARVLDVGTGSGCLAVTLAAERPRWRVAGIDRSPAALEVASRNRDRHGVDVKLWLGDLDEGRLAAVGPGGGQSPLHTRPPISAGCRKRSSHDPVSALDGGADGLDRVRILLADLSRLLRPCGGAILELGEDQADAVGDLAANAGLGVARRLKDPGGCERVLVLQPA